jgi:hypothetical protein
MDASAVLTPARNGVWTCIENWSGLADASNPTGRVFNREFRFDGDTPAFVDQPNASDLPSIAVLPSSLATPWITNQQQKWTITTPIRIWTADWHLQDAEQIAEEVIRAIFRYADVATPTVPYMKKTCGIYPEVQGATFTLTTLGKDKSLKAIETNLTIGLVMLDDPFTD